MLSNDLHIQNRSREEKYIYLYMRKYSEEGQDLSFWVEGQRFFVVLWHGSNKVQTSSLQ